MSAGEFEVTLAESLRLAADLVEQYPNLPAPYVTSGSNGRAHVSWYLQNEGTLAEQKADAARLVRVLGGKWNKMGGASDFYFKQVRGALYLTVAVQREAVCERVVTGTKAVVLPAQEAQPERTVELEIAEWRCEPLLAGADA